MKIFLIAALLISLVGCKKSTEQGETINETPPNIIYILADDMGWGDLSFLGQSSFSTPNIDRLSKEGMLFTQHYAGSAVCAPSRASLMTGLHTGHSPVRGNKFFPGIGVAPLTDTVITIPEAIKKNTSYVTGMSGRWHLGGELTDQTPYDRGFDYHWGKLSSDFPNKVNVMVDGLWDEDGRHKPYEAYSKLNMEPIYENGKLYHLTAEELKKRPTNMDRLVTDKGMAFMERNKDKPFFLYLAYSLPHAPMEYHDQYPVPENDTLPAPERAFISMMRALDAYLGEVIDKTEDLGIAKNTVLLFTTDNGAHNEGGHQHDFFNSNGPFREYKRSFYEGGFHSPMIVKWPGKVQAGARSGHVSAFWDVLPTVCEIAGAPVPAGLDGISFLPALLGKPQKTHNHLYWEFNETIDFKKTQYKQAVRKGKWKGIYYVKEEEFELFDLSEDLGETTDLTAEYPEVVSELREIMQSSHAPSKRFPLTKEELEEAGL